MQAASQVFLNPFQPTVVINFQFISMDLFLHNSSTGLKWIKNSYSQQIRKSQKYSTIKNTCKSSDKKHEKLPTKTE